MALAVRTYLEMTDPSALEAASPPDAGVSVGRVDNAPPEMWRSLYTEVGREYHWVDRLGWTDAETLAYLASPTVGLWVLYCAGAPAGYFELKRREDVSVEIVYFGLLPEFTRRGFGKHLLTEAVERAWARGAARVWLHTSSLDHSSALPNYLARGFSIWKQETYDV